ncbi:UDP-glycosyltransferase 74F2-like [Macadamia integrifolia]|uniref:UDP-glycosyltransferase 74F2-like n=1 Tax=Macadamia integrifolia TaxID=60698 RepID=UPI001C4E2FE8|nr:UDP-glycosyltransferase 74F2-like [Macadamia integrifolia]
MEKEKRACRGHVLVLPYPTQGHINPTLQFSKRLVSKGLKATLAVTIFISKSMKSESSSVSIETISDGFDDGGFAKADSIETYLSCLQERGSQTLTELIKKQSDSGYPVNCLVYDSFLPWVLDVAKDFGLISAVFFTQSCAVDNIYCHVQRGVLTIPPPADRSTFSVPGLPPLQLQDLPSFLYVVGYCPGYAAMVVNQFSNIDEVDWVLVNTFDKLENEVVDWMAKLWRLRTIGPTIPSMYLDKRIEDDKDYNVNLFNPNTSMCMNWLNDRVSGTVVYVSFGSLANLGVEQMEELAEGLKRSNSYILWVVRASERDKLSNQFVDEASDKRLVVTWCPQLDVLAHKAVGCFFTHCGWNSTLEALSLGVPMVGMPQWTDQTTNAKYVEDVWGVGIRVRVDDKGIVRKEEVELCIREVMEGKRGEVIKKNSIKWKSLAKEAMDKGGSSDINIDEFVAQLVSK